MAFSDIRMKYSRLRLSGVDIPPGADTDISMSITLISEASDMRRTVNAELRNVARSLFKKYKVSVQGSGMHPAGLAGLSGGDYVELITFEALPISPRTASRSVVLPRAGLDAVGITADGRAIEPINHLTSPLPLQAEPSAERIAELRVTPSVSFAEEVVLVRYHAALACSVVSWTIDNDERLATSQWSLDLEEL